MPADRRRHAALAAHLAQFVPSPDPEQSPTESRYAGLSPEGLDQCHRDYRQALARAHASSFTDEDTHALEAMRRRYTFRAQRSLHP
ncbi:MULTISPECIES: hypothetical protein [Rhodococcus]|uniref:hypothetical protein n=1 Tax=Rhodococcus TaxID=1827 RepID=UPI000B1732FC|nr:MULTISPECIES: hypothetical protein [Rhodococcus]MBX9152267.1 hypothetical protein [Rhodococcus qingshengii]